jgi:hypothetical protein
VRESANYYTVRKLSSLLTLSVQGTRCCQINPAPTNISRSMKSIHTLKRKCIFRLNCTSIGGGLTVMTTTNTVTSTAGIYASCWGKSHTEAGIWLPITGLFSIPLDSRQIMGSTLKSHSRFIPHRFQFISQQPSYH